MELQFLKKQTRAHKYLHSFTKAEIEEILAPHVPRLRSLHIFTTELAPPEVYDEYIELRNRIVERARTDLQTEFKRKIKVPEGHDLILKHYMLTL
jgi:RNase P subunit RPR2